MATWPVSSFSLLSNKMLAALALSATPKLLSGLLTHPWTSEVTSSATYSPAAVALKLAAMAPIVGAVA
jgi:hypothetical protein